MIINVSTMTILTIQSGGFSWASMVSYHLVLLFVHCMPTPQWANRKHKKHVVCSIYISIYKVRCQQKKYYTFQEKTSVLCIVLQFHGIIDCNVNSVEKIQQEYEMRLYRSPAFNCHNYCSSDFRNVWFLDTFPTKILI